MAPDFSSSRMGWRWLALALFVTTLVYWPGLHGGWLFDDYPNIVDNKGVQPDGASVSTLINAAFSSPSSEFKRPIASLSFAANYLLGGLDPFWMKLTNLLIHLINGLLVFVLVRALVQCETHALALVDSKQRWSASETPAEHGKFQPARRPTILALLISAAWTLLPINLTAVLYVVQRMESLANIFVLLGLIGYIHGRRRMTCRGDSRPFSPGFLLCLASLTLPAAIGVMAKETAAMLPLYAALVEWYLFGFRRHANDSSSGSTYTKKDYRLLTMFLIVLVLPLLIGLSYLLPGLLQPQAWSTRDFTMTTRLLSEARVVVDYIRWTLVPTSKQLSFYHDEFDVSMGLLTPWTTGASIACLAALSIAVIWLRRRRPLAALGIALFLASHLLTGTILPLELIYEHRNYFASLGLLLAVVPCITPRWLTFPTSSTTAAGSPIEERLHFLGWLGRGLSFVPLLVLMAWWTWQTAMTAHAWGEPLRLARELAVRGPESPRAQYELGRTYIIYSGYDPNSPFTHLAYAPLEQAANLPKSSILPQQALIFMNSRMHLPIQDQWWDSMIAKLKSRKPGVQDESSLIALMHCMRDVQCDLPKSRMNAAFQAAIAHPDPTARILAAYGEFAWSELSNVSIGEQMLTAATTAAPSEAAYKITLFHMLVSEKKFDEARQQLSKLQDLNMGGYLDKELAALRVLLPSPDDPK